MVCLVALLETAQDGDRVRDGRLADQDGLEAPLERGVLLDVLAVLVERRRADRAELAAASIGFSMLAASTAPSAAPAPTIVCSSSMKRMISPSEPWISWRTAFRRSSNSPRYFEPASSAPMSSAQTRLPLRPFRNVAGDDAWASPSTMAVLPTPGSPISTGLFFVGGRGPGSRGGSPRPGR